MKSLKNNTYNLSVMKGYADVGLFFQCVKSNFVHGNVLPRMHLMESETSEIYLYTESHTSIKVH